MAHHTVRTRTRFSMRKGSGTFFVYRRFCDESTQSGKRARAGYHYDGGILPFALRNQVRFVRTWSSPYITHWGQSLCTCVPGACTPLTRCNTLDFVPKSVCQGVKPLRIPAERVRTYAEKWQNFTISGCSFIGEYGILGLVQQIRIWRGDLHEKEHIKNRRFGNADYSCCIYNVCGEPSRNEFSLEQYHYLVTVWFVCSCDSRATYCT